ncbi:YfbU family protein [Nocardia farcinica]|uniref:YfbU family protein n=1 Tax=Nocardia farcinica TaxID=37329 RepID=UPI001894E569|nr:YfbU family protein [Nocardia farcinica]MBF6522826.1 YfbU family protein [Nocardia farcinica]
MTLRVDDATRDALEQLAQAREESISTLLRDQIDVLLGRHVELKRDDVPASVPMHERLVLSQQARTLAALAEDEHDAEIYLRNAEILEEGFTGEYGEVFASLRPELSRSHCALLWDILDMFRILGASIDNLTAEERADLGEDVLEDLRFSGFDLAHSVEGPMLNYLRFLIRQERWSEMKDRLAELGENGHSHHEYLPHYQRMLETYRPILKSQVAERGHRPDAYRLTADQLRVIAAV